MVTKKSAIQHREYRLTGVAPLVMHRGELADARDPFAQEIGKFAGKRKKSLEDLERLARLEFLGSLYMNENGPCIPDKVVLGMLTSRNGAARRDKQTAIAKAGIWTTAPSYDLEYEGPRDAEEMWASGKFRYDALVVVQGSRLMRCRPIFREWAATIVLVINTELVNLDTADHWIVVAGESVGIGEERPRLGRFKGVVVG